MTPLLLLPGMMCDERLFSHLVEADGTARKSHFADLTRHEDWSELASSVLAHAPPIFDLIGVSMGGALALELCALAPERVRRVVVLDANPHADTSEKRQGRLDLLDVLDAEGLEALMQKRLFPNYLAPGNHDPKLISLFWSMAEGLGDDVFRSQSHALLSRQSRLLDLAKFEKPVLILRGAEDRICPRSYHTDMLDALPNARFEEIDTAGHLPGLEAPVATTKLIQDWLR